MKWTTNADGTGDDYQPADVIDDIAANYDLYAQWRDIVYHITYNVNGNVSETENINYGASTTYQPSLEPLTFIGWSLTEGGSTVGKTYKPTGTTESITLYAVFGSVSITNMEITVSTENFPSGYSSDSISLNGHYFKFNDAGNQSSNIQFKKSSGLISNSGNLGVLHSIVITYTNNAEKTLGVKAGTTNKNSGTAIEPSHSNNVYTFDLTGGTYRKFVLYCSSSSYTTLSSIKIYYESASPVTVNIISTDTVMDTDIPANTSVVVGSGVTLTFNGGNQGTSDNLIIEDGGQLILPNDATVAATIKKNTTASTAKTTNNWYGIASPINSGVIADFVQGTHNVYRYDEENIEWEEYRNTSNTFTTFENGRGYLYRSTEANVEYAGTVNAGDENGEVKYDLSYAYAGSNTDFKGFNLIGNPFTHDVYKGSATAAIPNGDLLEENYCVLNTDGTWAMTNDGTAIHAGTAILVQAQKAGTLTMYNSTTGYLAPDPGKAGNDNIWFTVKNSNFTDVACVEFKEGRGFNKPAHYNENAPMLYIRNNGENFASVDMPDDTKTVNLCFKATEFGYNTLSLKANGNFSYLHLIDKLTGEDVDMLLEGEYSFMASPTDNPERFIVKLEYSEGSESSEVFAYQNGSDIIVSGEGELQVFDVMGRLVMQKNINGVERINAEAQGVYIFKLNEKTQKIVVR